MAMADFDCVPDFPLCKVAVSDQEMGRSGGGGGGEGA